MKFVFNKTNIILLVIAIITTIAGYIIMGTGDKTISPILLIIAYVILFPVSIIIGTKKKNRKWSYWDWAIINLQGSRIPECFGNLQGLDWIC